MFDDSSGDVCFRTYSKVMAAITETWGIRMPDRRGRRLLDCVLEMVETLLQEEGRAIAEEAALEAFRLAAKHLPSSSDDGLYVPATDVRIVAGKLGSIRLDSFCSFRPRRAAGG